MKKLLKILIMIEFVLILVIIGLTLADEKNKDIPTAFVVKENRIEELEFKIITKAVCEEKDEHVFCRDELFVKCNSTEYMLANASSKFIECNNLRLNLSDVKVKGSVEFKKN